MTTNVWLRQVGNLQIFGALIYFVYLLRPFYIFISIDILKTKFESLVPAFTLKIVSIPGHNVGIDNESLEKRIMLGVNFGVNSGVIYFQVNQRPTDGARSYCDS